MATATRISKDDIKRIYALGSVLGIMEPGNKDDLLHLYVEGITGKSSISMLTDQEARRVLAGLRQKAKQDHVQPTTGKQRKTQPGKMTSRQINKCWGLMYKLEQLDTIPTEATVGERMVGAIRAALHVDASRENPFVWLSYEQGNKLIEVLKGYVRTAERKMNKWKEDRERHGSVGTADN